jgi:hypothetical protein
MEKETINNKAIEEFIFIAELSCKCISDYLKLVEDKETSPIFLSGEIEWDMGKYYKSQRTSLYKDKTSMFNESVNIDTEVTSKLFDDIFFYEQNNQIMKEYTDKYEGVTKIAEYKKYLVQEFGTDLLCDINYLSIKKGGTFFTLLQDKNLIISLCEEAIKEIKATKEELLKEYYIRLKNVIEKLEECLNIIVAEAINIELPIKIWRVYLLEYSNKVLKAMPVEKVSEYTLKTRAFVLKSLLDTLGIRNSQANIIRFIANIIGTSEGTVKGYFIEFSKDNHGMKKEESFIKEMKSALNMCNLLSTESENNKYVIQLIDAIKNIKDARK